MKKINKIIGLSLIVFMVLLTLTGCSSNKNDDAKLKIVTTIFPPYDFSRAIVGNDNKDVSIKMLLKPGAESHSYEPSVQDIKDIENSDIFIYIGGESDVWVDRILESLHTDKTKVVRLMDYINLKEEEITPEMQQAEDEEEAEEIEYDEHIWTSLRSSTKLIEAIKDKIIELDPDNEQAYKSNAESYIAAINSLDNDFKEVVKNGKRKTLVFGDRFPFRYFVDDYNLKYYAAFPGCASQTEPSVQTITKLIDKVKNENIPVVFYIEFSNKLVANSISEQTGAKTLLFHSAHDITQTDFDKGTTYIDLMRDNLKNLKEALK